MNEKICDHKSVGMLVEKDGKLLIIERKKFPAGFALPAGHLDGDTYREAAMRELTEETGLDAQKLEHLFSEKVTNPCRRGGKFHYWQIFKTGSWRGDLNENPGERKSIEWASPERLGELMLRTEIFAKKYDIPLSDVASLSTVLSGDPEWQSSPGMEPVWYNFLKRRHPI